MTKVEQVAEQLDQLTLLEAAQLSKLLQEKWGVSAAAPMAVAAMPGMAGCRAARAPAAEEEKTEFDLVLMGAGDKKIQVIKVVRELTGSRAEGKRRRSSTRPRSRSRRRCPRPRPRT